MKTATVSIKCYKSNATVFAHTQDGRSLGHTHLDFDGCGDFATDENMAGFKEEILNTFHDVDVDPESLAAILATLRIHVDPISGGKEEAGEPEPEPTPQPDPMAKVTISEPTFYGHEITMLAATLGIKDFKHVLIRLNSSECGKHSIKENMAGFIMHIANSLTKHTIDMASFNAALAKIRDRIAPLSRKEPEPLPEEPMMWPIGLEDGSTVITAHTAQQLRGIGTIVRLYRTEELPADTEHVWTHVMDCDSLAGAHIWEGIPKLCNDTIYLLYEPDMDKEELAYNHVMDGYDHVAEYLNDRHQDETIDELQETLCDLTRRMRAITSQIKDDTKCHFIYMDAMQYKKEQNELAFTICEDDTTFTWDGYTYRLAADAPEGIPQE